MNTNNTMPIAGCIPNQLQALHDELGHERRVIAELRRLLVDGFSLMRPWHGAGDCSCAVCRWRNEVERVLGR